MYIYVQIYSLSCAGCINADNSTRDSRTGHGGSEVSANGNVKKERIPKPFWNPRLLQKSPRISLLVKQIRAKEENEDKLEAIRKSDQLKKFKPRFWNESDKANRLCLSLTSKDKRSQLTEINKFPDLNHWTPLDTG